MTVHHDKLLYGRLERLQSDFSDEETERAVATLNAQTLTDNAERRENAKKTTGGTNCMRNGKKTRNKS
ncbi:MAG: hypothetical protein ACI4RO_02160 [Candidatus Scatosoma sp.]